MKQKIVVDDKRFNDAQASALVSALRWGVIYPLQGGHFRVAKGTEVDQYHSPHVIERLTRTSRNHKRYLNPLPEGGFVLTVEGIRIADEIESMELSTGLRCEHCNCYIWGEGTYEHWDMFWCDTCKEFTLWENGILWGTLA